MDIKFDENNVPVEIDGKKVMKSYQNAYRKAMNTTYFVGYKSLNPVQIRGSLLNTFELSIYNWVMAWQQSYNYAINHGIFPITKLTQAPIQTFGNMRYFFSSINPGAYMDILDQTTS